MYDYIDFEIPGIIPIKWERNWYSDSKYKGALGHGYHHSYDIHLTRRKEDLFLVLPDGRPAFFPILTKEEYSFYNRTNKLTLTLIDEKTYELYNHQEQLTYTFKGNADKYQLIKISNSDEANVLFEYKNHCLSKITDTAGRIIKLESNGQNLITKIALEHKGEKRDLVSYAYNQSGDMITMTDALGQSTRAVYKNHLMVSKIARNGFMAYWEYDGMSTGARCIHTWCDGGILDYRIEYREGYNVVTNSFGHQSIYYYEGNLATKIIDPLGGIIIKEYDEDQKLIKLIDEEENETIYDYDDKGNLSTINYPDKSAVEYAYDDKGRLQLITSPEGGMLARSYKNNRLDTIISPDGLMTSFKYNKKGLVSRVFDNRENETKLFYDKDNNLTKMKFPNGTQSVWEYDEWGQCTKAINPAQHQQLFSYDIMGRVTNVQLPDNNTVQLKYDSYGRILESIDKHRSISFEYTSLGSLKSRVENGKKVHFKYNKEEELIGLTNEHGEYYAFGRDVNGRIQREVGYDGITRIFQRDKAGKVLKVKRPGDKYSLYEYDKAGRISRVEHQDETWATYDYNQDGLLIQAMNANSTVQFYRDQTGRIISEIQDGYKIDSEYGDLGLRTKIKSSLGADIDISHTDMGEVNSMAVNAGEGKIWEVGFKYNSLGMETERNLPGGISSQWTYDAAGRPQQQKVQNKGGEQRKRNYQWDVNDKLQSITNQLTQGEVSFGYDDFNNLAWAQYEDGAYDYKLPDEVGNLYRSKDRKDREYGKSGKLLRAGKTRFEYDEEGNLINKITPEGKWNYDWEAGGNLKSVIRPDNTQITMEYDALGRRTAKIISTSLWGEVPEAQRQGKEMLEGDITRFIWDGNVPLHEWKYALKDRPKLVIDELGDLSKDREEPIENLTTWIFDEGTFRPAAKIVEQEQYSIITDHLGTPVEMYNAKGEKTWAVEYDMYGKIRKLAQGKVGDCLFRYQGQYEDVETGLYYNRFRYYNADEGVYLSQDPIGLEGNNPNLYAYVSNSNKEIDIFGLNAAPETAAEWEARFAKIPTPEQFGAAQGKLHKVAKRNGWTINRKWTTKNKRVVYESADKKKYAFDTENGRFEYLDKRGKHKGEFNIDGKRTKSADGFGKHDLKCP